MRYYVYVSEEKINMLFSQTVKSKDEQRESSLGFDLKILKGEMKERRGIPENQFTRLDNILEMLNNEHLVGKISERKPYVKASLKMTWASFGENPDTPITFWSYFSRNIAFGLAGSKHNLIGEQPNGRVHSYSRTDSIIFFLRNELENAIPKRNDDDLPPIVRNMYLTGGIHDHAAQGIWEAVQLPGQRATYEFVAKVLFRVPKTIHGQLWDIILASPLYVSLIEDNK